MRAREIEKRGEEGRNNKRDRRDKEGEQKKNGKGGGVMREEGWGRERRQERSQTLVHQYLQN